MGRLGMATAPRITITMAITIAKTGRSIKNRAMGQFPCFRSSYGCGWTSGAGPHAQLPFDDHAFAGLQALLDNPQFADAIAGDDRRA